ncbi:MAG TPA: M50 family metallopeptidase, partial [Candidatus Eremiobacteraceae bacterium]
MSRSATSKDALILGLTSALAFATAMLSTTFIHEACHALAALALGLSPQIVVFNEYNAVTMSWQEVFVAAAGPLGSLVTGLLFLWAYSRDHRRFSYPNLLLLWSFVLSLTTFIEYLIITPFWTRGDTGVIARLVHVPLGAQYIVMVVGLGLLVAFGPIVGEAVLDTAPAATSLESPEERKIFMRQIFLFPLLYGLPLVMVACVGANPVSITNALLSVLGGLPIYALAFRQTYKVYTRPPGSLIGETPRIQPLAVVLYLALTIFYL